MTRIFTANWVYALLVIGLFVLIPNANAQQIQKIKREGDQELKAAYEFNRLKDPKTGKVPENIRTKELTYVLSNPSFRKTNQRSQAATWNRRGPYNVGGRTRALAIDRTNENIILAGGVSGGMWRSTNGGTSWTQTTGSSQLHSVTDVYQDPVNTNTWYYVSGEIVGNSTSGGGAAYRGNGVFKSTDGGLTWVNLASTTADPTVFSGGLQYSLRVRVDPTNSDVYVAAYDGIYKSSNGGTSFTNVLSGPEARYTDVAISATGVIYATLASTSTGNEGVFKSTNGTSWTNVTPSLGAGYARIVLDIAPSNENIIYVFANVSGAGTNDHQVFYSSNAGSSWTDRSANLPAFGGSVGNLSQGSYNQYIKIKPDNPNVVFIGSTNVYRTTNGFTNSNGNTWIGGYSPANNVSTYENHHPDNHALVFYPSNPARMITGHDGGISRTENNLANNGGNTPVTWTFLTNGYYTTQAYGIAIDRNTANDARLMAGFQDNGKWTSSSFSSTAVWGEEIGGGDGTYVAIASGKDVRYSGTQNGSVARTEGADPANPTNWDHVHPASATGQLFVNPFILDRNDEKIMYYPAGTRMWRHNNVESIETGWNWGGTSDAGWTSLSGSDVGTGSTISALDVSKNNSANVLYYGTTDGKVYRLDGANSGNPSKVDIYSGKGLPAGAYVSSIAVDPENSANVMIVFSNYQVQSIFYSTNAGSSWTHVGGNLEQNADGSGNGPSVRWTEIHRDSNGAYVYMVGTSTGLYATETLNGTSTNWVQEGANTIGNVPVVAIESRTSDNLVAIGTHGVGMFSAAVTGTAPACGTPGGLSATSITQTTATLNWGTVSSANNYDARYRVQGSSTWTNVSSISGTTTNLTGLTASTTYEYQVRANCSSAGSYSASATFATSGAPSSCNTTFPYNESFETNVGTWTQSSSDDLDWSRDANGTPSNSTGPSSANDGSYYIYVEASGNNTGYPTKVATITSECFDLSGVTSPSFKFDYHMYGSNMGTLKAEVSTNGGSSWAQIFSKTGDQGNSWTTESIDLNAYKGSNVTFRFTGTTGTSWRGDMALDNIRIEAGSDGSGGAPTGYCASKGNNVSDEWIESVEIGSINNTSGANGGYGDFTTQQTNMTLGSSVNVNLTIGWASTTYNEGFAIWIDYNRDGDFADAGEKVVSSSSASTSNPVSGSFTVSSSASLGLTRMRVAMGYNVVPSDPCASYNYGEVEDYLVNLVPGTSAAGVKTSATTSVINAMYNPEGVKTVVASASPNPAADFTEVKVQAAIGSQVKVLMTDVNGIGLVSRQRTANTGEIIERFDVSKLNKGLYLIRIQTSRGTKTLKIIKQ